MKTNLEVCYAFAEGKAARCLNMHSTGDRLFSYGTCIAECKDGKLILNLTKYSRSTTRQQSYMLAACIGLEGDHEIVRDVPMWTRSLFNRNRID